MGDVAEKTGYSREHLSRLLGSDSVDELLIWKISNAVGVNLQSLLNPEKRDECRELVAKLEAELADARQTIANLSQAMALIAQKNQPLHT